MSDQPRYTTRPLTEAELEQLRQEAERHRANGCRLFDEKFARCTCPEKTGQEDLPLD